ncbi:MAG: hypothetical protein HEP71_25285 [Roseivirga sp.]|nr:hypothetical protein [Roseivirga sp.]
MADKKSLLFTLSPRHIEALLREMTLKEKGYKVIYIVDTYDVSKYCFPLGIEDENSKHSVHLIADQQISLDYFFNKMTPKPIFCSEYNDELIGLRDKVRRAIVTLLDRKKFISKYDSVVSKELKNRENNYALIAENLSLLTSLAISVRGGDVNFNSLFKDNLIHIEDDGLDPSEYSNMELPDEYKNDEFLRVVFSHFNSLIDRRGQRFYAELFEKKGPRRKGQTYFEFLDEERQKELESAFRDALIIKRVLELNVYYAEQRRKKPNSEKVIVNYLSSAPWTGTVINRLKDFWPMVENRRYDFHRNDAQMFANLLYRSDSVGDLNKVRFKLRDLKFLLGKEQRYRLSKKMIEIHGLIEDERNRLENYKLLLKYNHFTKAMHQANEGSDLKENTSEALANVGNFINANINSLTTYVDRIDLSVIQLDLYNNLRDIFDSKTIEINYGKDPVESVKQQLPLVFNYTSLTGNVSCTELLQHIVYFCKLKKANSSQISEFRNSISEHFPNLKKGSPEEALVKYLVCLVLPTTNIPTERDPNLKTFENINVVLSKFMTILPAKQRSVYEDSVFKELRYIQVWASRRCQKYIKGLDLTNRYIKKYPKDPRFLHSRCLIVYAWIKDYESKSYEAPIPKEYSLNSSLKDAEYAIELYESFRENDETARDSIEALLNTAVYIHAVLASKTKSPDRKVNSLIKSRETLLELKQYNKLSEYKKHAEYLATEAFLELNEAEIIQNIDKRRQKLHFALESIDRAIDKCEGTSKRLKENYEIRKRIILKKLEHCS